MAVTTTDIANAALDLLGKDTITELSTDTTKSGLAINRRFTRIRDILLSLTDWNFATKRVQLASAHSEKTITAITAANPGVVTSASHGLANGMWIYIEDVAGMTELNGNWYKVGSKTDDTFRLVDADGDDVDTSGYTAYTSGGTATYGKPRFDWEYAYNLPSGCLRVLKLDEAQGTNSQWLVEGGKLLTDHNTATVQYVYEETSPTEWSAEFQEMMATKLALDLCLTLTGDKTLKDRLHQDYELMKRKACSLDGMKESSQMAEDDTWVNER